jgi:hypothetical protein
VIPSEYGFLLELEQCMPAARKRPAKGSTVYDQLIMTKRPSDSDALPIPGSKHARQELPPFSNLPTRKLFHIIQDLQAELNPAMTDAELEGKLEAIHTTVLGSAVIHMQKELDGLGLRFVDVELFKENVKTQRVRFYSLVRAVAMEEAKGDDVLAVINDSMYTFISGWRRIIDVLQVSFGLVRQRVPRVRLSELLYIVTVFMVMLCSHTRACGTECVFGVAK